MIDVNNVYNMDCLEGMRNIPDNSVDLIVTSPPYNVGVDYDVYNDSLPWNDYLDWCKEWLTECFRVLKEDGKICVNHYISLTSKEVSSDGVSVCRFPLFDFRSIMESIGYTVHKLAIWEDKTMTKLTAWGSWLSASAPNIQTPYEGILIAYKKRWKKDTSGVSTIGRDEFITGVSGIWNLGTESGGTKACFPESLPHMCINLLTYKGDTVLDPFSGSGTTCAVAKKLGRKFIGFELSENYYNYSIERLSQITFDLCDQKDYDKFDFMVDKQETV